LVNVFWIQFVFIVAGVNYMYSQSGISSWNSVIWNLCIEHL